MSVEPAYLSLREAFEKSGSGDRDAFLKDLHDLLAAGLAEAIGWPNGAPQHHRPPGPCEPRKPINTQEWRDLVLCFELDGCAAPVKDTEYALGGAWARRTGHSGLRPFSQNTPPVVWLDLLIRTQSVATATPQSNAHQQPNPNRGGAYNDTFLLEEMHRRIVKAKQENHKSNPSFIAMQLVDEAEGNGSSFTKRDRLAKKYKAQYPD